jgi:hypothetical protein
MKHAFREIVFFHASRQSRGSRNHIDQATICYSSPSYQLHQISRDVKQGAQRSLRKCVSGRAYVYD